ncbi:SanA/YdcF family protein [Myroides injenensis]|uniref:SanA/YdcF family protein n=1 Tax=Myroides injenensis TaxID=1183151 RepID=UPI000289B88E|nr:ElyC/SanA/YdcF family protein [Myroides injenensis]
MRKIVKIVLVGIIVIIGIILFADYTVRSSTKDQLFDNTNDIPHNDVGIVLGTTKYLKGGFINYYFSYRIKATTDLYKAGKINYIVVSGDNSRSDYNEPEDMKQALIENGVPEDHIYMDYAGLRTLDSVYRMKAIFGKDSFTIISQPFHNARAVYIGNYLNLNTVGYNAEDVTTKYGFKTMLREKFARVKLLLDKIFDKKPKFLGEPIEIGNQEVS